MQYHLRPVICTFCHALCAVKCNTTDGRACKFPFELAYVYNGCSDSPTKPNTGVTRDPWCKTTEMAYCNHIGGTCDWAYCQPDCPPHDGMHMYVV